MTNPAIVNTGGNQITATLIDEGYSQYLFVLTTPTGAVYPAGPISPTRNAVGTILVKDGIYEIGEIDAPHGNFSFTISAGNVFAYTATYLYDAIELP